MKGYPLKANSQGLARWFERMAQELGREQWLREIFVNSAQAGATTVIVDGWTPPDGDHVLVRISDNGCGMSIDQLRRHMATIHDTSKNPDLNWGIGVRITCLPLNQAGMDVASRQEDAEAMIRLEKVDGEYVMRDWDVLDGGRKGSSVTVEPNRGMLSKVKGPSGTVVVLHGDGTSATYDQAVFDLVMQATTRRFFRFPGDVDIQVVPPGSRRRPRAVPSLSQRLEQHALHQGVVKLGRLKGINVAVRWWLLPPPGKGKKNPQPPGGVGVLLDDEVLQFGREHSSDFGIALDTISSRVVLLIEIDDATMDTGRTRVIPPSSFQGNPSVPWKLIGLAFKDKMPPEIQQPIIERIGARRRFSEAMATKMDQHWQKRLRPVRVAHAGTPGESARGGDNPNGDDLPTPVVRGKKSKTESDPKNPKPDNVRRLPKRRASGDKNCGTRKASRTPEVLFVSKEDCNDMVRWVEANNQILVRDDAPPLLRDLREWKSATLPTPILREAIEAAYAIELASTVIDIKGQAEHPDIGTAFIEKALRPESLFTKLLGAQATQRIIQEMVDLALKEAS